MASHGTVLFYLVAHNQATIREIAHELDLTERRVSQVIRDLSEWDMLSVEKHGRRNRYRVNPDAAFENPMRDVPMENVVQLVLGTRTDEEPEPSHVS